MEDHLAQAAHTADRDQFQHFYQQLVDGESDGGQLEYSTTSEMGDVRRIRDPGSVQNRSNSGLRQVIGIVREIAEYKRASENSNERTLSCRRCSIHIRLACSLRENLVRNAVEHGSDDVTVTVGDLENGFCGADDDPGIPADERESVFDAGYSTADDGTGFGLSTLKQVADAHGWNSTLTESEGGGARLEIAETERV